MNRIPIETHWHTAKRRIGQLWRPNRPRAAAESDSTPSHVIAEKLEVAETFAPASLLERAAAMVSLPTMPGTKKEEAKQTTEALTAWEDEGGTPAIRKPRMTNDHPG